jgi:hypothetical protein
MSSFEKELRTTISRLENGFLIGYNEPINGKWKMEYCENESAICKLLLDKLKLVGR